jgi:ABC-type amino acid transport substrate-binding protein
MKSSTRLFGPLFLCLCLAWPSLGRSAGLGVASAATPIPDRIRVVYYIYPPHIFIDHTGLTGATYEVWNRLAKRMNVEIEWIGPVPFRRAQYMAETGEADAIMRIAKSPEREARFIFPKKATMWAPQGIVVLKSDPLDKITSADELVGKSLGMFDNGLLPEFIKSHRDKILLEPVPVDSAELNMAKLFRKRIWGVYFVFADVALFYAAKANRENDIKLLPYPGSAGPREAYIAISRKAAPVLVDKLLKAIDAEVGRYDYEKISRKYIGEAASSRTP